MKGFESSKAARTPSKSCEAADMDTETSLEIFEVYRLARDEQEEERMCSAVAHSRQPVFVPTERRCPCNTWMAHEIEGPDLTLSYRVERERERTKSEEEKRQIRALFELRAMADDRRAKSRPPRACKALAASQLSAGLQSSFEVVHTFYHGIGHSILDLLSKMNLLLLGPLPVGQLELHDIAFPLHLNISSRLHMHADMSVDPTGLGRLRGVVGGAVDVGAGGRADERLGEGEAGGEESENGEPVAVG